MISSHSRPAGQPIQAALESPRARPCPCHVVRRAPAARCRDPTRPDAARGSRRGAPARGRRPWRTTAGLPPGDRGEPGGDRELDGVEPSAWLTDVLERTVSGRTEAHELERLLPWNRKAERLEAAIHRRLGNVMIRQRSRGVPYENHVSQAAIINDRYIHKHIAPGPYSYKSCASRGFSRDRYRLASQLHQRTS
jgi:hypothetical protein